jgi:hypothetical protein
MRDRKIPPILENDIMAMSARGFNGGQISNWLKQEHKIDVSLTMVNRTLRKLREERKDVAKNAFAEAVSKSANLDLEIFDEIIKKLFKKFNEAVDDNDMREACRTADTLFKYQSRRMDMAGLDIDDKEISVDALHISIKEKLDKIK